MERIDWTSAESVVRAAIPGVRLGNIQKDTCGPTYFIENADGDPISASSFDMNRPWGFLRAAHPSVAALDRAHEAVVEKWKFAISRKGYMGWGIFHSDTWAAYREGKWYPSEAAAWMDAASRLSEPVAVAERSGGEEGFEGVISRYIARRDALPSAAEHLGADALAELHAQHERDQFDTIIALRKLLDDALAEVAKLRELIAEAVPESRLKHILECDLCADEPEFTKAIARQLLALLAKPSYAPGKVTWRVEQRVGTDENGEWQSVVSHSDRERVEPYLQGSRFPMRLVKITTTEEVISHRSKEKEA